MNIYLTLGNVINKEINPNRPVFNRTRQYLAYADGVLVFGWSLRVIKKCYATMEQGQLHINKYETKCMKPTRDLDTIQQTNNELRVVYEDLRIVNDIIKRM